VRTDVSLAATIGARVEQLDVETVVKASQALSSEIVLPRLIETLMRIAVEHAGAERGLLILLRGDEPQIEAEATIGRGRIEVAVRQAAVTSSDLPPSVLHYVIRTRTRVILEDASVGSVYSEDAYVQHKYVRSLLCLPIVKQTKLIGVLYLENNLTPRAFTADRVAVLELLASQAAISLENARLYSELQRSETFLAEGQRISATGSFGWNVRTGTIYWSKESYRIFGLDPATTPTVASIVERVHPDDRSPVQDTITRAATDGAYFDIEHRLVMPDGVVKHIRVAAHAERDDRDDVYFVGAVVDLTETKRAEEALRQAQAHLAHVSRVTTMGELTASLSHEVKQPIAAAVTDANTCVRWLAHDPPNVGEARDAALRVVQDGRRATEIISRIRLPFTKGAPEWEWVDVNELIQEMTVLLRGEAARYDVAVRATLAADLPPVMADRVQLQQVLMNLILNGIDAMKAVEGARDLAIISQRGDGKDLLVSVSDTGVGLPSQQAEQIFKAFFTTKADGLGMGLSISRSIVEAHGGRLWAADHAPRGATLCLTLPVLG